MNELNALKPELGLIVINHIREQGSPILETSNKVYPSPVKPAKPKYEYESPVKCVSRKGQGQSKDNKKKRILFTSVNKQEQQQQQRKQQQQQDDDFSDLGVSDMKHLSIHDDDKRSKLEERFGHVGELRINNKNQQPKRRSLDSAGSSSGRHSGKHNGMGTKSNSASGLTINDFIVKPSKKGKKKRKSGSPDVLNKSDLETSQKQQQDLKVRTPEAAPATPGQPPEQATATPDTKEEFVSPVKNVIESPPLVSSTRKSTFKVIKPNPDGVVCKPKLDKLIQLYSYCLRNNLVISLLDEVCLLMELLSVQETPLENPNPADPDLILGNVHNCVYFAVAVLEQNFHILELIDDEIIVNHLRNSLRIGRFSTDLAEKIDDLNPDSMRKKTDKVQIESVRFKTETDNIKMFPTERNCMDFKKQRDLFYDIVRGFNSMDQELNSNFKENVVKLIDINVHPVNLRRLAKLFVEQMLTSCGSETFNLSMNFDFPLNKVNATKLSRLNRRLGFESEMMKFQGSQKLYKRFIENCDNYFFIEHLQATLKDVIMEKNDDSGLEPDSDKSEIGETIINLRLSSKFLALVESLPFRCESEFLSESAMAELISAKESRPNILNLNEILKESVAKKRLIITLPWVIEYVSNTDHITFQTSAFQRLLRLITDIYKSVTNTSKTNHFCDMNEINRFFLNVLMGELFENPAISRDLFFNDGSNVDRIYKEQMRKSPPRSQSLDENEVIRKELVQICQGFQLTQIRKVLAQYSLGRKTTPGENSANFLPPNLERKAKKISLDRLDSAVEDEADRIQMAMESHFFHNNSTVKKSVDFVSERVASKLTSEISHQMIPETAKEVEKHFEDFIGLVDFDSEDADKMRKELELQIFDLSSNHTDLTVKKAHDLLSKRVPEMVEGFLRLALSVQISEPVIQNSVKITERKAVQRGRAWIKENITESKSYSYLIKLFTCCNVSK